MSKSLVKDSIALREALLARIKELGLSFTDVCKDSVEKGYKIDISAMSRYFKNSDKNKLSEEDILWLGYRYCVLPSLSIGLPKIDGSAVRWVIPPYSDEMAERALALAFPKPKPEPEKKKVKRKTRK